MKYTVYRTVNKINGKFYIGVHKTAEPNDEYLGSGKYLQRAVEKHGRENFVKEILAIFDKPEPAFELEQQLVDQSLGCVGCYNLKRGGDGGYDWINKQGISGAKQGGLKRKELAAKDPELRAKLVRLAHENGKKARFSPLVKENAKKQQKVATNAWKGQKHSDSFKEAQRRRVTGRGNPNFGKKRVKTSEGIWLWI